ncbi:hypothetical protein OAJ84_02140 [Candidatus Puniceispirillum sp.]|nr:hypothetical protein [Candidatus Puniceispirillum sp.]
MLKPMRWMIIPSMLSFSTLAFAGGVPTELPTGANSSGKTKTSTTTAQTKASKAAKAKSIAAKKVAKKITKASAAKSKKVQQTQVNNEVRSPAGFRAVEDEKLVIDSSQLRDGDGLGEVQLQWQISENGDDWMVIPGAVSEAFTPRDQQVGKYLRVQVSYIDGQGNPELINSPSSLAVENVNDTPVGLPAIIGDAREGSSFTIDTSRVNDEDGIGAISYAWQRSKTKTDWETISEKLAQSFRILQADVGYSYRASISYIDGFGTRELLVTEPSEVIANVDNPLEGDLIMRGQAVEGSELVASTSGLSDYDGIESINLFWEASIDGQTWDRISLPANADRVLLSQRLVGMKIRARAVVRDNFGIETVAFGPTTEPVRNINNKPVGVLLIKRVGS